jgi:hypothetical protein
MEASAARKALNRLIRDAMPRVADIVRTRRAEMGDAWVQQCQQRGLAGEPGWFYAREGALAIGRLWPEAIEAETAAMGSGVPVVDTALVCIRPKDGAHGA